MPIPPPIHKLATPLWAPLRSKAYNNVTKTRQPDAPMGWPKAIAPPFTFTLSGFIANPLSTARDWAANASFNSNKSTSSLDQFALESFTKILFKNQ